LFWNQSGVLPKEQLNQALQLFLEDQGTSFMQLMCYSINGGPLR